jgi:hypothetical protein
MALLRLVSAIAYCRRYRLLPLFLLSLAIVDVIADVDVPLAHLVLLSELDAAGHTDAPEILLLHSSDVVAADVKLGQRPHAGDGISKGNNTCKSHTTLSDRVALIVHRTCHIHSMLFIPMFTIA